MSRPLYEIAREIRANWHPVPERVEAYLGPMSRLNSIYDMYFDDTARSVVTYFLGNARSWCGPTAKRIKNELKELLK